MHPVASGVLDYFPDAIVAVARVSYAGNEQHNPGQPLHWARGKSGDHADALARHFLRRGTLDGDGIRHTAKIAWRALAMLQEEIEASHDYVKGPSMPESALEELKRVAAECKKGDGPGRPDWDAPGPGSEELMCSPQDCDYSCATRGGFCRKPRAVPMEDSKS